MFRHRQQRRRWAARLLVLWLIGVGIGIANACLLVPGMVMSAPSPAWRVMEAMASQALGDQHGLSDQAADDPGALADPDSLAAPSCVDCCAKASASTPLLKSALDGLQCHAAVPTATATVLPFLAFAPLHMWVPRRDGVPALPIPIAFLRLAL
ncbi:MAG: hypothetical protein H7337_21980 [Rhizobacter sp.]|nr:hypothetical protein [Rhizobacter sp.]